MIRSIFRFFFKSFFWISALLGALIIFLGLYAYFKEAQPNVMAVPNNALLTVELSDGFVEHKDGNLLQELFMGKQKSLFDLTQGFYNAAADERIKAVAIYLTSPGLGFAQIQEIRDAIQAFRATGKKVYLYSDSLGYGETGNSMYYLASACNEIWVQPIGTVGLTGLQLESPFLKGLFDHLDIKPEFAQRKEYKSFAEMYTHSGPTPANTEAMQAIADSLMSQMVQGIAKDRNLSPSRVEELVNEGPYLGENALSVKLIDRLAYRDNIKEWIEDDLSRKLQLYEMDDYAQILANERSKAKGDKVALIFDSGMILRDGSLVNGSEEFINNDETHRNVMTAINDNNVKAIVYRISSPGGDPVASQSITHILLKANEAGKPVIISMGDTAASGGYWIACGGSKIVAQPGTLTGSIGVLSGKFSLKGLWEKIGVNWSKINVGENGGMWSFNEDFTSQAWVRINQYLDYIYQRFIALVAKARNLPLDKVEKVAKGRVWTGEQAQALGLVDQLGGLEDALRLARSEAGLPEDAPIAIIPKPKTLAEKIVALISGEDMLNYDGFLSHVAAPFITLIKELSLLSKLFAGAYSIEAESISAQKL